MKIASLHAGLVDCLDDINCQETQRSKIPVLQGHPAAQEHAEVAVETREDIQNRVKKLYKEFRIYRWSPDHPTNNKPFLQSYYVDLSNCGPMIKAEDDSSLSYRSSREGICGSCAMNIDGTNTVACLKPINADTCKPTAICYHSPASHVSHQRSGCGPYQFLPAVHRDNFNEERLQALTEEYKRLYRCRTIKNCTETGPKSLNPADAVHKMKAQHMLSEPVEKVGSLSLKNMYFISLLLTITTTTSSSYDLSLLNM
ncbi:hypothetical protein CRYUN_Cryun15aG0090900 [Craigia yunnanensis]